MRPPMLQAHAVTELPELWTARIPADWQDLNGHVNVRHYVEMYDLAGWRMLDLIGIDERHFRVERRGLFDLEHHIWYLAELHVGDAVSVHVRFVARGRKLFHGVMFVVNRSRGEVASALEFLSASADLDSRTTVPIPASVAGHMDRLIRAHTALGWAAPRCGTIAV